MVHTFVPINNATIKDNYPIPRIEDIRNRLSRSDLKVFFSADAANGYWAVTLYPPHLYKTAVICMYGQVAYTRIGQGLTGGCSTYARLKDIVTGPIPSPEREPALRKAQPGVTFAHFVDDDHGGADTFANLFDVLNSSCEQPR